MRGRRRTRLTADEIRRAVDMRHRNYSWRAIARAIGGVPHQTIRSAVIRDGGCGFDGLTDKVMDDLRASLAVPVPHEPDDLHDQGEHAHDQGEQTNVRS
jgi:transposase-like protein